MSYIKNLRKLSIGALSTGNNTIVAGGQLGAGIGSIRVWQVEMESSGATVITPYSNTTQIPGSIAFTGAGSSAVLQNTETPWMETLPGQALIWNLTAGATLTGAIWYSLA